MDNIGELKISRQITFNIFIRIQYGLLSATISKEPIAVSIGYNHLDNAKTESRKPIKQMLIIVQLYWARPCLYVQRSEDIFNSEMRKKRQAVIILHLWRGFPLIKHPS